MTPKLRDIIEVLEALAPSSMAEDWDNPGLQVGDLSREIHTIFVALDPTFNAVQEASRHDAQLLLTHHPLIFKPISQIEKNGYPGDVIYEAVTKDVSIVSAHTNLDMAKGGINDLLAKRTRPPPSARTYPLAESSNVLHLLS